MSKKIVVPSRLIFQNSIEFVKNFPEVNLEREIVFDFTKLRTIDPFSLLYVSSEIQRYRHRFQNLKFKATNIEHCTYAAHMGFFQSFGVNYGKKPGEAKGGSTYIPINIYIKLVVLKMKLEI